MRPTLDSPWLLHATDKNLTGDKSFLENKLVKAKIIFKLQRQSKTPTNDWRNKLVQ